MHRIHFSLSFNDAGFIGFEPLPAGHSVVGPRGLRDMLLHTLGLPAESPQAERLRILLYQQALYEYQLINPDCFYKQSFDAHAVAVAQHLLAERDALIGGGWSAPINQLCPPRLCDLANVEALYRSYSPPLGFEDQINRIMGLLESGDLPGCHVYLYDPLEYLTPVMQRLLDKFKLIGVVLTDMSQDTPSADPDTDLSRFRQYLVSNSDTPPMACTGDGSIRIIESHNDHAAARIAATLPPVEETLWLIDDQLPQLNATLHQYGHPVIGSTQTSFARPFLQILTLAPSFLWHPIDTQAVLQFLHVRFDHIPYTLRRHLSSALQESPGIGGPRWQEALRTGLEQLPAGQKEQAKTAYAFWFERPRYDPDDGAPKAHIISLYEEIMHYARSTRSRSLSILANQAQQICLMLQTAVADTLTAAQLDQILSVAIEPAAQIHHEPESGHLTHVYVPTAIGVPVRHLIWWHCTHKLSHSVTLFWSPAERQNLTESGVVVPDLQHRGSMVLRDQLRPILMAQESVTLIKPVFSNGQPTEHHPIFLYLHACFGRSVEKLYSTVQPLEPVDPMPLPTPISHFEVNSTEQLNISRLSPTSIDTLVFYPHIWVMRYAGKLKKSPLPNPADINKLQGLISHATLEALFKQPDCMQWESEAINKFVNEQLDQMINQEGAVLLAFGNEAALHDLRQNVLQAAHSLHRHIQHNGWRIMGLEVELTAELPNGTPIAGFADMILTRGAEFGIIDIKWAGSTTYYTNLLQSHLDIQLMCYAYMLNPKQFAHTGYYLISSDRLICRNKQAFAQAHVIGKQESDHTETYRVMLQKLVNTLNWRYNQLNRGFIEVRNEHTALMLEQLYNSEELLSFFELPKQTSRFDEFSTIAGLVQ